MGAMLGIFIATNPEVVSGEPGPDAWMLPLPFLALAVFFYLLLRRDFKRIEAHRRARGK